MKIKGIIEHLKTQIQQSKELLLYQEQACCPRCGGERSINYGTVALYQCDSCCIWWGQMEERELFKGWKMRKPQRPKQFYMDIYPKAVESLSQKADE